MYHSRLISSYVDPVCVYDITCVWNVAFTQHLYMVLVVAAIFNPQSQFNTQPVKFLFSTNHHH